MIATLIAAFVVFGLVALAMSVGALVQGKRLRGSCGAGEDCSCSPLAARDCRVRQLRQQQSPS